MAKRIVVVGAGPAGVFAAIEAKRTDPVAEVTLLSDEGCEPYEKPPLSKGVLTGKSLPEHAPTAGRNGIAAHDVLLECGACCTAIDRAARAVVTSSGRRFSYDALILAPGSINRELPQWPVAMPRVHYLRTEKEARSLKSELAPGKRLLIIGGGLIGLEVAASAAVLGVKTTVLEVGARILARVCDEETGTFVAETHRRHGVDLHTGEMIDEVRPHDAGIDVTTKSGKSFTADVVVVGAGVKPNIALAAAAGLETDDGILVDEHCRTSDPAIFACGDAVRFPGPAGPIRLENWRHAQDHGTIAGRNAAGVVETYKSLPSFWSEQYDLYIQGVGWPAAQPRTRVHRTVEGGRPLVFELDQGMIAYAMGINVQRDIAAARRLIERKVRIDAAALADPSRPLAAMLG
ncbi:MAG TPA: FAD-dependent oxidoreductase [Xanthobacteraceae bacterium]|jgi:NADPH-dependent 2,4-dienoyl-CoA reductase/sulfur reductase-like enzyme|nr:FAD-dependent oxidoreductase [Xanthobacteraceae bacterium]